MVGSGRFGKRPVGNIALSLAARPAFGSAARAATPLEEEAQVPPEPTEAVESTSDQGGWLDDTLTSIERALGADSDAQRKECAHWLTAREASADVAATSNPDDFERSIRQISQKVLPRLLDRIDTASAAKLSKTDLTTEIRPIIGMVATELRLTLNRREQAALEKVLIDEIVGLGPLEELLADSEISDILVNGPHQIFIERRGKLELSHATFRDEEHLFQIAQRICNRVGRRIDQSSPLADARLEDGSRVNIVAKPLSLRGPTISIRKFASKPITLEAMAKTGACSEAMATVLRIAAASRFNIVISGGTGSGKTTLLNALSKMIDPGERVITIEDAAELQLRQPHVVTMETRPANVEGQGAVTIRDLVINALRMRPDRIILGEVRGAECFDMLQAMNTGHDGSMCTLHSNSPREAMSRLENMVMMSEARLPRDTIARQIAEAVDLIIQVKRLRDGSRRITSITEVTGIDGKTILSQELFKFEFVEETSDGRIIGAYKATGNAPHTVEKARMFGLDKELLKACRDVGSTAPPA